MSNWLTIPFFYGSFFCMRLCILHGCGWATYGAPSTRRFWLPSAPDAPAGNWVNRRLWPKNKSQRKTGVPIRARGDITRAKVSAIRVRGSWAVSGRIRRFGWQSDGENGGLRGFARWNVCGFEFISDAEKLAAHKRVKAR
jgi:hypothetical protein